MDRRAGRREHDPRGPSQLTRLKDPSRRGQTLRHAEPGRRMKACKPGPRKASSAQASTSRTLVSSPAVSLSNLSNHASGHALNTQEKRLRRQSRPACETPALLWSASWHTLPRTVQQREDDPISIVASALPSFAALHGEPTALPSDRFPYTQNKWPR